MTWNQFLRAAPLVQAKVKITVKTAGYPSLPFAAYGVFDCDFGFPSHEWSCSKQAYMTYLNGLEFAAADAQNVGEKFLVNASSK